MWPSRYSRPARVVEEVISIEPDRFEGSEPGLRARQLGDGDRPVERDDVGRLDCGEVIVQCDDLSPVGGVGRCCVGVHRRDRRLDLERARRVAAQAGAHQLVALHDEGSVPQRPILIGESHERAIRSDASRPARVAEQHQRGWRYPVAEVVVADFAFRTHQSLCHRRFRNMAAAIANASLTASSARSMSPRTRTNVAGFVLERPNLDRSHACRRTLRGPSQRGVQICGLDHPETAHLFLGLCVRTVGHRHVTVGRTHDCCGRVRVQPTAEHKRTAGLQVGVEGVDLGEHLLHRTKSSRSTNAVRTEETGSIVPLGAQLIEHPLSRPTDVF